MKDWLLGKLGGIGLILYYVVLIFISVLPIAMLNVPLWATFLIILVVQFLPFLQYPLWIAGFIGALYGPQDTFAYIYYVIFGIAALAVVIRLITTFLPSKY